MTKTKKEWQEHHGFSDEDMAQIELSLSISKGRITDIFNEPLKYQGIKIKIVDKSFK